MSDTIEDLLAQYQATIAAQQDHEEAHINNNLAVQNPFGENPVADPDAEWVIDSP